MTGLYRSRRSQQWGSKYDPDQHELTPAEFDYAISRGTINAAIADLRAYQHLLTDQERLLLIAIAQNKP